jgi:hypothetical protein
MNNIKAVKYGDIYIDEHLLEQFHGLSQSFYDYDGTDGDDKVALRTMEYLFRRLKFVRYKTAEGDSGWVLTKSGSEPL